MNNRVQILDEKQTVQKIRRIAHEILEQNFQEEQEILLDLEQKINDL